MNYKNFDDIGSEEPRGWTIGKSTATNIEEEEDEDNEIPTPYCDEFEDEEDQEEEEEVSTQDDETSSIGSTDEKLFRIRKPRQTFSYVVVLQEETDFIQE